jgi:hypothetical protein
MSTLQTIKIKWMLAFYIYCYVLLFPKRLSGGRRATSGRVITVNLHWPDGISTS